MMIGILSPFFYTVPTEGVSDEVTVVSALHIPADMDEIHVRLRVKITNPDAEDEESAFRSTLKRPDDSIEGEPWAAFLPLPLVIKEWRDGTFIEASLVAEDEFATAQLKCRLQEKPQRQHNKSKSRPKKARF